jgi:hypothetical protein
MNREAANRGIVRQSVQGHVAGEFGADGESGKNITCRAQVAANAREEGIETRMRETDRVAKIQNTLRAATPVQWTAIQVISVSRG